MPSAKTKRRMFTALTVLVYLGMPVFVVLCLHPAVVSSRDEVRELADAESFLGRWVQKVELPTQTRIDVVRGYKEGMAQEYARVVGYLRQRNASLERRLLDTQSGDPVRVKLKYERFKQVLMQRASYSVAKAGSRAFMPAYPWETADVLPRRKDFGLLDRKAAIADLVVGLLGRTASAVGHLAVGDPVWPDGAPVDDLATWRQEAEAPESDSLGYIVWPVRVELVAGFARLGSTVDALVTPAPRWPCILVHRVEMTAADGGACKVRIDLGVLEFD